MDTLLGKSLLAICKSFLRSLLYYGDIVYDWQNKTFWDKLESVQYNAALAITGAIKDLPMKRYSKNQILNI